MRKLTVLFLISISLLGLSTIATTADQKDEFTQISQAELDEHLRKSINREDKEFLSKTVIQLDPFDDSSTYKIYKADEDYIHLGKDKKVELFKWDDIKPWVMCELYWLIGKLTAGDYWAMAEYAFDNQLEFQGSEFLGEMCRLWKTLHRKAERYMAKKIDVDLPETGFELLDLRPGRWRLVSPNQKKAFDNADAIEEKVKEFKKEIKNFAKSRPGEKRDESFSTLKSLIKDVHDLFADIERFEMMKILLDGFEYTVKKTKEIKNRETKEKWEELEIVREIALKRIFDTAKYPDDPENAPEDGGQTWVNEAVSNLRILWISDDLGRMEPQLLDFSKRYIALFHLIDDTQKYYTENEFKHQINLAVAEKIDKALYKIDGNIETEEELETRLYQEVNAYRDMFGLELLKKEKPLGLAAKGHALHMNRLKVLSSKIQGHPYGETLEERIEKAGYKTKSAIDLISDKGKTEEIMQDWQNKPVDHRKLLTKDFTKFGVGIVENYSCLIITDK